MNKHRRAFLWTAVILFAAVVFIVDLHTPHDVAEWVLYLPLILAPVWFNNQRQVVATSAACSVLVVLGLLFSPEGTVLWFAVLNRAMGLIALWLAALAGILICQTRLALAQSEERLRLAMQGAGMGTWDEDLRTGHVVWSATLFQMFGYPPTSDGQVTRDMWFSRVHPDDRERVLDAKEKAKYERSVYCPEYRIIRADNRAIVWLAVFGHFMFAGDNQAVRFLGVAFDITRRKELESEVLEIAAREQQQIGQELHDGVGQELTGLGLMAESLAQRLPETAGEKRIALRLIAGLDSVHQKVRELSRGLVPVHVEARGLAAALDDLATRTTETSGIPVTCECPDWVEMPDHATATQLFRIAQEAISNALRHGRPRHVRLTLLTEPNGLRLRIKDDGIGVPTRPQRAGGLGLQIMHYRAGLIGGVLQIGPSEGGGTVVTCTLTRNKGNGKKEAGECVGQGEGLDRG